MRGRDEEVDTGQPWPAGHVPLEQGPRPAEERVVEPEVRQADDVDDVDYLQSSAGNAAVASVLAPGRGDLVRAVVDGPGRPMDAATSSFVRGATGKDASGITVHEGPEAAAAARSVDADMFASGSHLVAPTGLDVTTREGAFKTLHEVHHIVSQQAKGPVEGAETADGLQISDPSDRFEREADRVAAEAVEERFGPG